MNLASTYFYTATILNWSHLLKINAFKDDIIGSLELLINRKKIRVYGFVIMPNHIHLIWRNLEMNGKEFPEESFKKFTSHVFKKGLTKSDPILLESFLVNKADRQYQFWMRNALPIEILSREMLEQKLTYLHMNPLQAHWDLASDPNDYYYTSCPFYERGDLHFNWLTDYREDF